MKKLYDDVRAFHERFAIHYEGPPRFLPPDIDALRVARLREEVLEYEQATTLEDKLDALIDLVYIAVGGLVLHGFDRAHIAWDRVHAANMLKERAASASASKHGSPYDIIKPAGWVAPTLDDLVR